MLAKRHRTVVVLALCVLALTVTPVTRALTMPYGLERLCDEAARVVWGEVVSVQSHWDDGRTGIKSTVILAVNQYLRGAGAATLSLEVEGGEIDGLGQWVEDAPRFATGEEAVVFLDKRARVLGGAQGKFTGVAGRVVEAGMQPLSEFVSQLQERLGATGGALATRTVRQGANAWSTIDYAYHALKFWGTTSRGAPVRDGVNVVSWGHTAGSLATTTIWYDPSLKTILEFDMVFEDDYLWNANVSCPTARYDVRNVAAHEFGHVLGLADQYGAPDVAKTMYGYAFPGEIAKRSLDKDAIAGVQWIY
jgi:hypothetical protein